MRPIKKKGEGQEENTYIKTSIAFSKNYGYHIARMRYEIILAPEAMDDLKKLEAYERAIIRDVLETHLRHEPTKISKSRIKRLKGLTRPQFRLRVDDTRIFYDVSEDRVEVLAVVTKSMAQGWLNQSR